MTWGWSVMILSLATALFLALRCFFKDPELLYPAESVVGCSFLVILMTLCAQVLPSVMLSRGFGDEVIGHYTGVGTLILALVSGIPLMLIRIPLYNLMAYLTLRLSGRSIYPVFFHQDPATTVGSILAVISDTVIPAFGIALFFFGFLWSRFKSTDRLKAYIVIIAAYALYSMDFTSVLALVATGIWCCYLRSRTYNMWAPFLCLISMKLSELLLPQTLSRINIFEVQTYADIGSTYFYASLPAFFMGMVLLLFFIRVLDSFAIAVRFEVSGSENDENIPAFDKSINLSLLLTIAVFVTVWVLIIKGVHL